MSPKKEIQAAIARSISHNEIVRLPFSNAFEIALVAECEDSAEAFNEDEYWGSTRAGEWRVHLVRHASPRRPKHRAVNA